MDNKYNDLISFLAYSIDNSLSMPKSFYSDWERYISFAKEQSVIGLFFFGIEKLYRLKKDDSEDLKDFITRYFKEGAPDRREILKVMGNFMQIEKRNVDVNNSLKQFSALLKKNEVNYCVFKGQTIATYYEHPNIRTSGDIDFYVCKKDLYKAKELLSKRVLLNDNGSAQHWEFEVNSILYEMHFNTAKFNKKDNQDFWDELIESQFKDKKEAYFVNIDGEDIPTFNPTINAAYLFIHIYHHFMKEGIGLRQFCDWMVILRKEKEKIDRTKLNNILEHIGYVKAYKAFGCILVDYLGLKEDEFPYDITNDDRQWSNKILDVVFHGGNFGKHGRINSKPGIIHSLETGMRTISHIVKFYSLSPKENLARLPQAIKLSIIKYLTKLNI